MVWTGRVALVREKGGGVALVERQERMKSRKELREQQRRRRSEERVTRQDVRTTR